MRDFIFQLPTKVVFGKGSELKAGELLKEYGCKKVMIHYGGGSAIKSGLISQVEQLLRENEIDYILFGGVQPNPRISKIREGIALGKTEGIDFILAVGGGSVIDSAKGIGYGIKTDHDIWDFFTGKAQAIDSCPVGCILTIAAAGSETGPGCVITNEEGWYKRGYISKYGWCKFAILNPELTYTLPPYQTACGCVDIMMHTLERYFHSGDTLELTDRIAEGLLQNVLKYARVLQRDPQNYIARAEIMWSGSLSHNDLTGLGGGPGDWIPHKLQNELGSMFDVAHGASLAAVWGSWARFVCRDFPERFVKLAVNVLGVNVELQDQHEIALNGIYKFLP
jgi:alcohol dehydrogenase YqhD (iron-dependent ADH family)